MKKSVILLMIVLSSLCYGDESILDCDVNAVYDSDIFEEGLSEYEYPSLYVDKDGKDYIVSIGIMLDISTKEGDTVKVKKRKYSEEETIIFYRNEPNPYKFQLTTHIVYRFNEDTEEVVEEKHAVLLYSDLKENINNMPIASFQCEI